MKHSLDEKAETPSEGPSTTSVAAFAAFHARTRRSVHSNVHCVGPAKNGVRPWAAGRLGVSAQILPPTDGCRIFFGPVRRFMQRSEDGHTAIVCAVDLLSAPRRFHPSRTRPCAQPRANDHDQTSHCPYSRSVANEAEEIVGSVWLGSTDTAAILGVTPRTSYRWIDEGPSRLPNVSRDSLQAGRPRHVS